MTQLALYFQEDASQQPCEHTLRTPDLGKHRDWERCAECGEHVCMTCDRICSERFTQCHVCNPRRKEWRVRCNHDPGQGRHCTSCNAHVCTQCRSTMTPHRRHMSLCALCTLRNAQAQHTPRRWYCGQCKTPWTKFQDPSRDAPDGRCHRCNAHARNAVLY